MIFSSSLKKGKLRLAYEKKDAKYLRRGNILRKQIITMIKEARACFIKNQLQIHSRNSKKLWKSIKSILFNNKSANIDTIFYDDLNDFVKGSEAANLINTYFTNIGKNLANKIDTSVDEFWPLQVDTIFDWGYRIVEHDVLYSIDDRLALKS